MKTKTAWMFVLGAMLAPMLAAAAWAQKGPGPGKPPQPGMEDERDIPPGGPEGEEQAMEFARENFPPEMVKEIEQMRQEHPDKFRQKLHGMAPILRDPEVKAMFVRGAKAEFEVRRLVQAVKKADAAEKEKLKKELESALNAEFDAKLAGHELKLKKRQEEITNLKSRIEKRRALKDKIVQKRLGEVMGEVESWDW
jgi:ParB-like chromosome segregation protein Spo0J